MLTPPPSLTWADLVDHLVIERGSLSEVARVLYDVHPGELPPDPTTVERGLRRLRKRGSASGDRYGRLVLRHFGVPPSAARWARALGTYHGPLIDLPTAVRREQLRMWDRPPLLESAHAAWIHLAVASLAHHDGRLDDVDQRLTLAALGARRAGPDAELEHHLFAARRAHDADDAPSAAAHLAACEDLLPRVETPARSCFEARWLDQQAYALTRAQPDDASALAAAAALLSRIDPDGVPFVAYRHHHGLAWVRWRQGDTDTATAHAQHAVEVAGDGGMLRLRAASLRLLAHIEPGGAERWRRRAAAILSHLEEPT